MKPLDAILWLVAFVLAFLAFLAVGAFLWGVVKGVHDALNPTIPPLAPEPRPASKPMPTVLDQPYWVAAQMAFVASMTGQTIEDIRELPTSEYLRLLTQIQEAAAKSAPKG